MKPIQSRTGESPDPIVTIYTHVWDLLQWLKSMQHLRIAIDQQLISEDDSGRVKVEKATLAYCWSEFDSIRSAYADAWGRFVQQIDKIRELRSNSIVREAIFRTFADKARDSAYLDQGIAFIEKGFHLIRRLFEQGCDVPNRTAEEYKRQFLMSERSWHSDGYSWMDIEELCVHITWEMAVIENRRNPIAIEQKATSLSSEVATFRSLQEAKQCVDQSFEELVSQLKVFDWTIRRIPRDEEQAPNPDAVDSKKKLLRKLMERLLNAEEAILQSVAKIGRVDPYGESQKYFDGLKKYLSSWRNELARIIDHPSSSLPNDRDQEFWDPVIRWIPSEEKELRFKQREILRTLPGVLAYLNPLKTTPRNLKGRRKKDLRQRSNREILIAVLQEHHRFDHPSMDLFLDAITPAEAASQLGKHPSTLSRTWPQIKKGLSYEAYVTLCGKYDTLKMFLEGIDTKGGYLERSNRGKSIALARDQDEGEEGEEKE